MKVDRDVAMKSLSKKGFSKKPDGDHIYFHHEYTRIINNYYILIDCIDDISRIDFDQEGSRLITSSADGAAHRAMSSPYRSRPSKSGPRAL